MTEVEGLDLGHDVVGPPLGGEPVDEVRAVLVDACWEVVRADRQYAISGRSDSMPPRSRPAPWQLLRSVHAPKRQPDRVCRLLHPGPGGNLARSGRQYKASHE